VLSPLWADALLLPLGVDGHIATQLDCTTRRVKGDLGTPPSGHFAAWVWRVAVE